MPQEWTAYSQEKNNFKFVKANTQKEAIRKAVNKYDILPQTTDDVRPRTGDATLMTTKEFNEYMEAGLV